MSDPLITYLNDHIGGAQIALQVLKEMRDQHDDQRFREFATALLPEIEADDGTLRSIVKGMESSPSAVKQAGGWVLEKFARLKLGHTGSTDFRLFEALELLALGIQGKLCLWKALDAACSSDVRFREHDFKELSNRAKKQYEQVESQRLDLARTTLRSGR